ncbi:hypothetical protein LCGC14_1407150 [marine sediment metagenome]|uniref:Uncharacterized protein n=1 Tax=marine sediment metagenome TaxID=412755 RepID=A0A0F9MAR5_9ZZZZ
MKVGDKAVKWTTGKTTTIMVETELPKGRIEAILKNAGQRRAQMRHYYNNNLDACRERRRQWIKDHPEADRDSHRRRILGTSSGRLTGLDKRTYPSNAACELCHHVGRQLGYHHWNDENPNLGLWLCTRCHNVAEAADDDTSILSRYYQLKEEVETCTR